MRIGKLFVAILLGYVAALAAERPADTLDITAVGKDPRWKVTGRDASVVDQKGKRALKMSVGPGIGLVWLDGYDFSNGVIEVDILGRSQPVQSSFVGVAFRIAGPENHDAVYFRPFNFRAANADSHSHAVQYVSEPNWGWKKLREEREGQFENAIVPEPDGDEWLHARVVVERPNVTVFVNGATAPCLSVKELSDRTNGGVGLWVGDESGGFFANLRVTRTHKSE